MCEEVHHSHFQSAWMTWNWPDKCHISPESPPDIIGNSRPKYRVSCLEHTFFNVQVSFVYLLQYLASQCGRYHESGPFRNLSVFHGEIFSVVPKGVNLLWQHSSVNWPSHMNVVSQKIECRVSSCLSTKSSQFHWNSQEHWR